MDIDLYLDEIFTEEYGLIKKTYEDMNYVKCFYTDSEEKKYLFIYSCFDFVEDLEKEWKKIQNSDIALHLQNRLYSKSDLRWDMYYVIVYNGFMTLPASIIFEIERDKFCCRKIVLHAQSKEELLEQLNAKLPISKNFYYVEHQVTVFTDDYFYQEMLAEVKLLAEHFADSILLHPVDNKVLLINELRKMYGGENNE